jgi:DNA-binding response OmpR family regulator
MKRIALIEDDSGIAFTVRLNLQREGYDVTSNAGVRAGRTADVPPARAEAARRRLSGGRDGRATGHS